MTSPASIPLHRVAPSRDVRPYTVTVDNAKPVAVLPINAERRSGTIINTDPVNSVFIVAGQSGKIGDASYELKAGEGTKVETGGAVYLLTGGAFSVLVKGLDETGAA